MTPEARWKRRVEMFESLKFHDFFSGPGPMLVDGRDGESEQMINPPDAPLVRVLAEAVKVAGLQGRIRLTVRESHWTARPYRSIRVSVLDWGLLPHIGRQSYEEEWRKFPYTSRLEGDRPRYHRAELLDVSPFGETSTNIWGPLKLFLAHAGHPLEVPLLKALQSSGTGTAVWPAWIRCKTAGKGSYWYADTVSYADLPCFRARYLATDDVLGLLEEGIVLLWPPTKERMRIRFNRSASFDPGRWQSDVWGERLLTVEPSAAPLTRTTKKGNLQIFGRGRSQQTDAVPVVEGMQTICLACWTAPEDYTVTIMATLAENGMPVLAWIDGSCT